MSNNLMKVSSLFLLMLVSTQLFYGASRQKVVGLDTGRELQLAFDADRAPEMPHQASHAGPQNICEDDYLWLLPSAPLVLALGHGLINNILARCAGSFVLPLRFYQAPVREWITGSLKFAALAYLTKYAHSKFKDKAKRWPILARLEYGAYLWNVFYMGGAQMFAERIPLSWHGTRRTYPRHRSMQDIWFSSNVQFAFAYSIEAHLVKIFLAIFKRREFFI